MRLELNERVYTQYDAKILRTYMRLLLQSVTAWRILPSVIIEYLLNFLQCAICDSITRNTVVLVLTVYWNYQCRTCSMLVHKWVI